MMWGKGWQPSGSDQVIPAIHGNLFSEKIKNKIMFESDQYR
jgi:hypothetical protein